MSQIDAVIEVAVRYRIPAVEGIGLGRGNLPTPLTSFVGRDRSIEQITRLFHDRRLVTLVGIGGVGKTRLALAAVERMADQLPDGARLVELGALSDPALVADAVTHALELRDSGNQAPAAALTGALRGRDLLLVLDNCEHLLASCAQLVDLLLRRCAGLRVLATSREPLGVPGELVWRVPPLSLSYPGEVTRPDQLLRSEAVRLFVERARLVQPEFALTPRNARAVAEICYRLDGLPLAIELAAARVNVLAVDQIAARLGDRFALLTAGARTALPRQQTLRATLDWSYELLGSDRRELLGRLAVFAGGWTLDATEALWEGEGSSAFDAQADLVEKSLVVADVGEGSDARYRLMETVREYAGERLRASGHATQARRRHAEYYTELAERSEPGLRGPDQLRWLERLDQERDNLRAALDWASRDDAEALFPRLLTALGWFWYLRGTYQESGLWREQVRRLAERDDLPATTSIRALTAIGFLAGARYDLEPARELLEIGLSLARRSEDRRSIGTALARLGYLAMHEERLDAAAGLLDEALEHHRATDDRWETAFALMALGHVALHRGDLTAAAPRAHESLDLFRQLGDRWGIARSLHGVGQVAFDLGDYRRAEAAWRERVQLSRELRAPGALAHALDLVGSAARLRGDWRRAAACYEESLPIRRAADEARGTAWTLHYLGVVACQEGDAVNARARLAESLTLRRQVGEPRWIALALEGFAALAVLEGSPRAALRLAGAATALRSGTGEPRTRIEEADLRPWVERAQEQVGAVAAEVLLAEGAAMPLDRAVELALSDQAETAGATRRLPRAADADQGELTAREREVAGLIARGLSNRAIAERLVIAEGTAGVHVNHVLTKLGLHNRAQVAVWAVEHGLIAADPAAGGAAL